MRKGFTLIELLAVIVILAIIALIATPIILNIIDEAKDNASLRSAEFYLDAVENSILIATLNNRRITDGVYNVLDTGNLCLEYDSEDKCVDELVIEVNGEKPTGGSITITDGKIMEGSLVIENNLVTIKPNGELIIGDKNQDITLVPGLYDKNNKLIASWEELVEKHDFKNKIEVGGKDSEVQLGLAALVIDTYEATKLVIDDSVTSIGNSAFSGCSSLTSITIPDSVTSIGQAAFSGCSSLTSITIPDSVTTIEMFAFYRCSGLTNITIPDGVTKVRSHAFVGCSSLTSITIPESVTSIGAQVFENCSSLASIKVEENNSVYDSRNNSNAIIETATNKLIVGGKNTIIPDSVTSIGDFAFAGRSSLTSITIPDSVTTISSHAFSSCSSLASIKVDENNSVYDSRNNSNAIIETATNKLIVGGKNTIIPSSVTSIGQRAFRGSSSLTSITIPDSVTSIGPYAFDGCSSLTSINYIGTEASWNNISKDSAWDYNTPANKVINYNYVE